MNLPWQPTASLDNLRIRAEVLRQIREFFAAREVTEVETPLMCYAPVTDPFIQSIYALFQSEPHQEQQRFYLQTSPEYAMKRLLAAGSGPIYQICKAFRQGEIGRLHNPEFTMLEWYRPGFNHHELMDEMDEFLQLILQMPPAERKSYAELFQSFLEIDPHHATTDDLAACAAKHDIVVHDTITDRDTWLNLLMSHYLEPKLGLTQPCFIYDFPASQAALAQLQPGNPPVASRFEVFVKGIELANGFHELQDANEQRSRFEKNLAERKRLGLPDVPIDEFLLAAMEHGLPPCAGVALGVDRLVMIVTQSEKISDVLSFDFMHA